MKAAAVPTVFVIDDDGGMRQAIQDLVESVARGVDMFDCVLPTRNARNGQAFTIDGPVTLKQARGFMSAMAKGDGAASRIIGDTAKQVVDGLFGKKE